MSSQKKTFAWVAFGVMMFFAVLFLISLQAGMKLAIGIGILSLCGGIIGMALAYIIGTILKGWQAGKEEASA